MFSLNLVVRVSFAFLAWKVEELLQRSLFSFWMAHETRHFSDGGLLVQSSFWIFWQRDAETWLIVLIFYCTINRSYWECTFSQKLLRLPKKTSIEIDQYYVPVQRSRKINILSVFTYSRCMRRLRMTFFC